MKKYMLWTALTAFLFCCGFSFQNAETGMFLTVKENTNVYINPGEVQGVVGELRAGQPAIAIAMPAGGWIPIYYAGMIRYIQENAAEFRMLQSFLVQAKMPLKEGLRINVLGDSISFGDKLKDKSKAYPYVLADKAGTASLNNYAVCGSAIAGPNPDRFIDRYAAMDRNADLVLVFGGTNDYGVGKGVDMGTFDDISDQTFCGALNLMMCGLKQMYPDSEIVFATPLRRWGDKRKNAKGYTLQQYVSAIHTLGNFWGIRVIDLYSAPELNFAAKSSYLADGLHPKASGHTLIGNVLYRELFEGVVK